MAIEVQTQNTTCWIKRLTNLMDYDSAYTVTFRLYAPATGSTSDMMWGLSGATGYSGGAEVGDYGDEISTQSDGDMQIIGYDGTSFANPVAQGVNLTPQSWHSIAIVRESLSSVKLRYAVGGGAATNYTSSTQLVDREATAIEFMLSRGNVGGPMPVGTKITNFKCWTAALTDGEVDAEMLTTAVQKQSGFYSQSSMGDEQTLSGNLTQVGSGSAWTAGAGVIAGSNDPAVNYSGSPALSGITLPSLLGTLPPTLTIAL